MNPSTLYRKNGNTHTIDQVRILHPQTSIPVGADLSDLGYTSIAPAPVPQHDTARQGVREIDPIDGLQTWQVYPLPPEQLALNLQAEAEAQRARFKAARDAAVRAITVTTASGKQFDGDEASQTRMARAIVAMQAVNATSTLWVLADNTSATVTPAELAEALVLAGQQQTALWVQKEVPTP